MFEKILLLISHIPKDKLGHMVVGLFVYCFLTLFISPMIAFVIVVLVAGLKELYDFFHQNIHTSDTMDFLATLSLPFFFVLMQLILKIVKG